ncbi:nickel/cobalt transporter [Actinoplanes sp. URMC 104]|uniref:nickel/cobalt transporter n=1 Tax=Actinoplanes sp. URMC 104 TaxID=3423409 RepID=UPI003F1C48E0
MNRLLLLIVPLFIALLPAQPAAAHPLDVYLQAAYITPAPSTIAIELAMTPGVLVAPAALADLDTDHDRHITQAEADAYAGRVFQHVSVSADDRTLALTITKVDVPSYLAVQAGYGTVRIQAQASGAPATVGSHNVVFRNDFAPQGATYQVNGLIGKKPSVSVGKQHRDKAQRQSRIDYRIDAVAVDAPPPTEAKSAPTGRLAGLLGSSSLSMTLVLFALAMALLLGALHALTPGHAKTLMAAYLVGSGGTTRNALALGAVVTFTHTASVIVIGLIALFASRFLIPGVLVPALEIISGVLVLAIGVRLIRRRRRAGVAHRVHVHDRDPVVVGAEHSHPHDDHSHVHEHGGRPHTHALPAGGITPRSLIAMGISGGLVPCPEALGVMVVAVGVNRTVFGLGLILSFSLGLAAVLMGVGVMLVRSRALISRFEGAAQRCTKILPAISALVVTALGAGLLVKGLQAGLPLLS